MPNVSDEPLTETFFETHAAYAAYFQNITQKYATDTELASLLPQKTILLERIYVPPILLEFRTPQEIDDELELATALNLLKDKKLALEIERFIKRKRTIIADMAVPNYRRLLVVGRPGTGKTTWLKHLALTTCQQNIRNQQRGIVPILLPLDALNSTHSKSIFPRIAELLQHHFPSTIDPSALFEHILASGPCLLMLDGFEHLATLQNCQEIAREILSLACRFPACSIIITATNGTCHSLMAGFQQLVLEGFDERQVWQFLHHWFPESHTPTLSLMAKLIDKNDYIRRLAKNPLMLTLMAIICEADGTLPARRTELYQRLSQVVMHGWQNKTKPQLTLSATQKEFALRKLAYETYCQNCSTISEEQIVHVFARYPHELNAEKQTARQFLAQLQQFGFLLVQVDSGLYEFFHAGWREYFAALELWHQEKDLDVILSHLEDPWWEEPILFYTGMMADATPLLQRIINQVGEDNYYSRFILAGKCLAEARLYEPQWAQKITLELWSLYQDDVVLEEFGSPMDVLSRIKPEFLVQELIHGLRDADHHRRSHAAYVLESLGGNSAVPPLLTVLAKDKKGYTRGVAAAALGAIGNAEQVVSALIVALKKDKNSYVRAGAIEAFRVLRSIEAIPALLYVLKNDANDYVRSGAADALGNIGVTDVIPVLAETLALDPSIDVRISAAQALGILGSVAALHALTNALQRDEEWQVRVSVLEALEELGSVEALPVLTHALTHDKDWQVRVNIVAVLCVLGCVTALSALVESLQTDPSGFVRYRAAKALGKIGDETTIPILKKAQTVKGTGADKFIKKMAQQAIQKIQEKIMNC